MWLYHRFSLSFRDVEGLLAERGVVLSYETIRQWCQKFGPHYAQNLRRRQGRLGDIWHIDELFVNIQGKQHFLWRAVDQDRDVTDILVRRHRNAGAAKRFFRKLLRGQSAPPWRLVTDNQWFLAVHGIVQNLFRLGHHHLRAKNYRLLRERSFLDWREVTAG